MGEKLKIKDIEGDSEALTTFFASTDCSLAEYLNARKKPQIKVTVLACTVILYLIFTSLNWCIPDDYIVFKRILTVTGFALFGACSIFIHLYWNENIVTAIGIGVGIVLFALSLGVMSPDEGNRSVNYT